MLKSKIIVALFLGTLLVGAAPTWAQTVAAKEDEGKLIAVLKSDTASRKDKSDACRLLAIIATEKAIPALEALLSDEKLSHNARYALEPMPDSAVDKVFRDALGRLKGLPLVGVIGSVGVRGDAKAVPQLASLLKDSDPLVAGGAARALGQIGNLPAATALQGQLASAPKATRLHVIEGLFRCAEGLAGQGDRQAAQKIYDKLRGLDAPHQVRAGALRGAILVRGGKGIGLLRENLSNDDYILFSAAVQTAQEMPGSNVTTALAKALDGQPADNQILITYTLGARGDAKALPALSRLAKQGPEAVRIAAIKAIAQLDQASTVSVLVELMGAKERPVGQAAQEALGSLTTISADKAVMDMFNGSDTAQRLVALELMERRRMTPAVAALLKASGDKDAKVRPAAIKMVGELGGPDQLMGLLDVLAKQDGSRDLEAARQAISNVCGKAKNPESCAGQLIERLGRVRPAQKIVLLRVLSGLGGPDALKAVCRTVGDSNDDVHKAAIRALGTWKTADAAPHLLELAKAAGKGNDRALCLRAYLAMAARRDLPAPERLSMCRTAAKMVQSAGEKRLLLGALGSVNTPAAMTVIAPYLNDAAIEKEAALASLGIAERLLKGRQSGKHAPQLIAPLEKVVQAIGAGDLAPRAKTLLRQAKTKAGR